MTAGLTELERLALLRAMCIHADHDDGVHPANPDECAFVAEPPFEVVEHIIAARESLAATRVHARWHRGLDNPDGESTGPIRDHLLEAATRARAEGAAAERDRIAQAIEADCDHPASDQCPGCRGMRRAARIARSES